MDNVEDRWARGRCGERIRRKKQKTDRGDLKHSGVFGKIQYTDSILML